MSVEKSEKKGKRGKGGQDEAVSVSPRTVLTSSGVIRGIWEGAQEEDRSQSRERRKAHWKYRSTT